MAAFSTSNLKLASAGDVVKIWDSSTFKLCNQIKCKNVSFQSVHWSSDFRQTVSIPDRGNKIVLNCWTLSPVQHVELSIEGCSIAQFSSTSPRFLGVGTKAGSALIYDIKHKKAIKTFGSAKSAVTCLQYNWNDSYIACGYDNGSLMLHNSNTGQSSSPLVSKGTEKIRSLHYSYIQKSLIGCCSEDGGVMLWDANTRQLCARFREHLAPATGLKFSPVNKCLLASIGLDKKIHFYDISINKFIRTMDSDAPLCSLDFKEDGFTLAAGCTRGRIYFYDLRSPLFAHNTIQAHTTSVQSLAFQSTVVSAASKEKMFKRAESSKADTNESYDASKYVKNKQFDASSICLDVDANRNDVTTNNRKKESLTADIFSPIRESTSFANDTNRNTRNSTFFENSNFSFAVASPLQEQKNIAHSTKFSVGGKNISEIKMKDTSSLTNKKAPPTLELATKPITVNIAESQDTKNKNGSLKQQLFKAALSPQSSLGICSRSGDCTSTGTWSCNPKDLRTSKRNTQNDQIVLQQPKLLESVSVPNDGNNQVVLPKTPESELPEHTMSKNNDILAFNTFDSLVDEGKGTSTSTTPMTPQAFQTEFFKQLITDTMEEHTDAIRRYFHRLHVQMARDFERQSEQLEEMFLRHAATPDHIYEMRRRREDCYLQNIFR